MFQYLFDNIDLNSINATTINKLKNKFYHIEKNDIHILSENGLYKIIDDKIFKFSLIEQENIRRVPFKKTFLIKQNFPFIKNKYPENWIPPNHESVNLNTYIFKHSQKSNTELHIIYNNDIVSDIFILSNLDENRHSFKEDLEIFYRILI